MKRIPTDSEFMLPLWNTKGYRATALAYMDREGVKFVEHANGEVYSRDEIYKVVNRYNPQTEQK